MGGILGTIYQNCCCAEAQWEERVLHEGFMHVTVKDKINIIYFMNESSGLAQ